MAWRFKLFGVSMISMVHLFKTFSKKEKGGFSTGSQQPVNGVIKNLVKLPPPPLSLISTQS